MRYVTMPIVNDTYVISVNHRKKEHVQLNPAIAHFKGQNYALYQSFPYCKQVYNTENFSWEKITMVYWRNFDINVCAIAGLNCTLKKYRGDVISKGDKYLESRDNKGNGFRGLNSVSAVGRVTLFFIYTKGVKTGGKRLCTWFDGTNKK